MVSVDLNADLGESFGIWELGDDDAMLDIVTSANIACGFHAGDPVRLAGTCRSAAASGVRIGAQVAYHDLGGFGRRYIDVEPDELTADVIYQIGALQALAQALDFGDVGPDADIAAVRGSSLADAHPAIAAPFLAKQRVGWVEVVVPANENVIVIRGELLID